MGGGGLVSVGILNGTGFGIWREDGATAGDAERKSGVECSDEPLIGLAIRESRM